MNGDVGYWTFVIGDGWAIVAVGCAILSAFLVRMGRR